MPSIRRAIPLLCVLAAACGFGIAPTPRSTARSTDQLAFWSRLTRLCGRAFEGRMTEGADSVFLRNRLVMSVRSCAADEVRIGFAIGPDASRSWVVRRVDGGLALTHDVPGERVSGYGGVTVGPGSAGRQDFAADSATARMLPPAASNVWTLELVPARTFSYTLARPGTSRRFRLEFDLSRPVAPPAGG